MNAHSSPATSATQEFHDREQFETDDAGSTAAEALLGATRKGTTRKARTMRAVRVVGASFMLLVLSGLFINWLITPVFLPKTSDAWINAPLTSVRADVEGEVRLLCQVGETVKEGTPLANISNSDVNQAPLWRLQTEIANLEAELVRQNCEASVLQELKERSINGLAQYRNALLTGLKLSLQEAESKTEEIGVEQVQATRVVTMYRPLKDNRSISDDRFHWFSEAELSATCRLAQARTSRERILNELDAVQRNVFIQRDSPIYLTWSLQVEQSIPQQQAKMDETRSRLLAAQKERDHVEILTRRLAGGAIRSSIDGIVWSRHATSGPVGKGERLFDIAEAPKLEFIEAQFPEGHARSLYRGAKAIILLTGSETRTGTVRALRQPNPTDLEGAYAIRLPRRLNQVRVFIQIDQATGDASLLGRQCRVLVLNPRPRVFESFAAWLFRLFQW